MAGDTALLYGLDDIDGVANPLLLADAGRYRDGLESRSSPLYDLLNTRYVIVHKDAPLDRDKFVLAFDGDPKLSVFENKRVLPRGFLASQVQSVPDHEAAWAAISPVRANKLKWTASRYGPGAGPCALVTARFAATVPIATQRLPANHRGGCKTAEGNR